MIRDDQIKTRERRCQSAGRTGTILKATVALTGPLQEPACARWSGRVAPDQRRLQRRRGLWPTAWSTIARADVDASEQYHAGPSGGARRRNSFRAMAVFRVGRLSIKPPTGSRP